MGELMTTRENFLQYLTGEPEELELPGGMTVTVRGLTLMERERVRLASMMDGDAVDTVALETETVLAGLVEPKLKPEDIEQLRQGRAGVIDRIAQHIMTMSGMGEDMEKKAGPGS